MFNARAPVEQQSLFPAIIRRSQTESKKQKAFRTRAKQSDLFKKGK